MDNKKKYGCLPLGKEQRQRKGLYNQSEVCRMSGMISPATLHWWIKIERVAGPSVAMGNKKYYTKAQAEEICRFVASREPGQHAADIFEVSQ